MRNRCAEVWTYKVKSNLSRHKNVKKNNPNNWKKCVKSYNVFVDLFKLILRGTVRRYVMFSQVVDKHSKGLSAAKRCRCLIKPNSEYLHFYFHRKRSCFIGDIHNFKYCRGKK